MMSKTLKTLFILCSISLVTMANTIDLPKPETTGGMPLMEALSNRRTSREFSNKELSKQELSNLLWAMWGINRPDGRRTAPTARNSQAIDLYVINPRGVYRYDAQNNSLLLVKAGDHRSIAGTSSWAQSAVLNVMIVADLDKMSGEREVAMGTANLDAGFVAQNAYLFAASFNMNCVARMMLDRDAIRKTLGFGENKYPVMGMTVGH